MASSERRRGRLGDVAGRENGMTLHDGNAQRWGASGDLLPPYRALLSTGRRESRE